MLFRSEDSPTGIINLFLPLALFRIQIKETSSFSFSRLQETSFGPPALPPKSRGSFTRQLATQQANNVTSLPSCQEQGHRSDLFEGFETSSEDVNIFLKLPVFRLLRNASIRIIISSSSLPAGKCTCNAYLWYPIGPASAIGGPYSRTPSVGCLATIAWPIPAHHRWGTPNLIFIVRC